MKKIADTKMTLREVAEATGAAYRTVAAYAQKAGWTQNGKQTRLDEAQVTMILEAMKQSHKGGVNADTLQSSMQVVETEMTLDIQLAIAERNSAIAERNAKELWKRKALQQEARAVNAELKLSHTKELLEYQRRGLESYQRMNEAAGLTLTDRDDLAALYRRGRHE